MWEVLRIVLWVVVGLVGLLMAYFVFACVCSLFVNKNKDYVKDSKFYRFLLHSITAIVLWVSNVKIHFNGKEKIPQEGRFLVVCNHRSNYDALCTWNSFLGYNLSCISKPSNFKIPFFSMIAKRCCFMSIDRDNARNAVKTVNLASELMTSDEVNVLVFPEGTRSKTKELLPFHNMMFRIAQKAQVPIVVCSICGTENVHKRAPFRRTHVYLDVLEVVPTEFVLENHTSVLGERISATMTANLKERDATVNAEKTKPQEKQETK